MMVFTREVMRAVFYEDKPSIHTWERPERECRGGEYKQEKCCGKPRAGLRS